MPIKEAWAYIYHAKKIGIICHQSPDGDAVGSVIGLGVPLKRIGKDVTFICVDKVPRYTEFLIDSELFVQDFDLSSYDLLIVVDCGGPEQIKFPELKPGFFDKPVINIDHHSSNSNYGDVNIVDTKSPSTTSIIYKMLKEYGLTIDADIATALMLGIYYDTGSFMHPNTTLETFNVAADLSKIGARIDLIYGNMFKKLSPEHMKLWGRALNRAKFDDDNILSTVITREELELFDTKDLDLSGLSDILNTVPEAKYSVLITEDDKGNVKSSYRTRREDVDLSEICKKLGGGGHRMAAGAKRRGRILEETDWKIISD